MYKFLYMAFCVSWMGLSAENAAHNENAAHAEKNAKHGTEAMVISCMDYRLRKEIPRFMKAVYPEEAYKNYDEIVLPGASMSKSFDGEKWRKTLLDTIELGVKLHGVKKVIFIDHKDCGAYKAQYKKKIMAELDVKEQEFLDRQGDNSDDVNKAIQEFITKKNDFIKHEFTMHQEEFKKIRQVLSSDDKFKSLEVETYIMPIKAGEKTEKCKEGLCEQTNHMVEGSSNEAGHSHGSVEKKIP